MKKVKFLLATETSEVIKEWQDKDYEIVFILGQKKKEEPKVVRPDYSSKYVAGRSEYT